MVISDKVERFIAGTGKFCSWLNLAVVVLIFIIVVFRYVFNVGWIWLQEGVTYMHAAIFMLGAAWTFALDGHVRVDIFYRDMSKRRKALVNVIGALVFLLPFCLFCLWVSFDYVLASWQLLEGSREAGGMPGVYLLKTLIPLMALLMLLQGLLMLGRQVQKFK
jgi:TRAP-type mannitol/chloroaromatic compound transport system permease small subunit